MKTTKQFEQDIQNQLDLNKIGIYEVFVNESELRNYWGLTGNLESKMMKKCYAPVFDGKVLSISFEKSRAIRNLFDEAGVNTFAEFDLLLNN